MTPMLRSIVSDKFILNILCWSEDTCINLLYWESIPLSSVWEYKKMPFSCTVCPGVSLYKQVLTRVCPLCQTDRNLHAFCTWLSATQHLFTLCLITCFHKVTTACFKGPIQTEITICKSWILKMLFTFWGGWSNLFSQGTLSVI